VVDIASLLNLQARARRNALLAARALRARRAEGQAAERALAAQQPPSDAHDRSAD
jgi:hypothetical protein